MGQTLSDAAIEQYREKGYLSPMPCLSVPEVAQYRNFLEAMEFDHGGALRGIYQFKPHIHQRWAYEVATHPTVLDAVSEIIGPNILIIQYTVWIKEPGSDSFVSWHQDGTYFGLAPFEHITAWMALSPSNRKTGCVEVIPGSHVKGQRSSYAVENANNMLTTGQHIDVDLETEGVDLLELEPGEFSLHHTMLLHNSQPNRGADRRIGLGISYIPTHVSCSSPTQVSAMLVRGVDTYHHFELEAPPEPGKPIEALQQHAHAMKVWRQSRREQLKMRESAGVKA